MSSFTIYGLNGHESMPLDKVFKKTVVEKTAAVKPARSVDDLEQHGAFVKPDQHHQVEHAYHAIDEMMPGPTGLLAGQVMAAPVVTLRPDAKLTDALQRFQHDAFRHIPVVTRTGRLIGIISDRDLLRYLAGITDNYQLKPSHRIDEPVGKLMTPRVLTASPDTEVRYIARLFVEQHIGAMPIVAQGELQGIITRSDILGTVMRIDKLELWA